MKKNAKKNTCLFIISSILIFIYNWWFKFEFEHIQQYLILTVVVMQCLKRDSTTIVIIKLYAHIYSDEKESKIFNVLMWSTHRAV